MQEEIHTGKKLTPFKEHPSNSPSNCLPLDDPPSSPRIDEEGRPLVTSEEILLQRGKKFIPSPPDSGACTPRLAHTGCSLPAGCTTPDQRRGKKLITLPDDIGKETTPLLIIFFHFTVVSMFFKITGAWVNSQRFMPSKISSTW